MDNKIEFKEGPIEIERQQRPQDIESFYPQTREPFYPEKEYKFYFYVKTQMEAVDFYIKLIEHGFAARHLFKQVMLAFMNNELDITLKELCQRAKERAIGIFSYRLWEKEKPYKRYKSELKTCMVNYPETIEEAWEKVKEKLTNKLPEL